MNVIWIVSDTFRRDHLGAYGSTTIRTPSLDAFAQKTMRFDRYYAAGFPTMPTRADHFTGRWTMSYMGWEPLREEEVTLAQVLTNQGFRTAAVVDTPFYIRREENYDRGFETFFMIPGQSIKYGETHDIKTWWRTESDRYAPQTMIRAMDWLELHYKENFFLYIDTWDPHEPWDAPNYYTELYYPDYDGEIVDPVYGHWQDVPGLNEDKVKKAHATYCGEVTMVDTWVGFLLRKIENLGLMQNTAVIFTTDHGYYFGEHGGFFGKMCYSNKSDGTLYNKWDPMATWTRSPLYEEIVNIPLLIYVPGLKPGVYSGLTAAVDMMPTVLEIMGQDIPESVEGKSLLPKIKDPSTSGREFVVSTNPFCNPGDSVHFVDNWRRRIGEDLLTTVTTDEWSFLYSVEPEASELYHLPTDPGQMKNLIEEKAEVAQEIHELLVKFMLDTKLSPHLLEPRLKLRI
jgi:arylsulfatase A-like enzyme